MIEQLSLFSHDLAPLPLRAVVLVRAEGWIGVVSQIWPGRDYYAVFAKHLPMDKPLPSYRRDELDLLPDAYRAEADASFGFALPGSPERIAEEQRRASVVERARAEVL